MSNLAIEKKSQFDGGLLGLIGVNIVTIFFTLITLGIAYPWLVCYKLRWITSHTIINGYRLKFNGTGASLFVHYIKWFLLTIVTLGIYGFWLCIKMKQWEVSHTEFE